MNTYEHYKKDPIGQLTSDQGADQTCKIVQALQAVLEDSTCEWVYFLINNDKLLRIFFRNLDIFEEFWIAD